MPADNARTVVFQSKKPSESRPWIAKCVHSVEGWAQEAGFKYLMIGDELFDEIPASVMGKCAGSILPATDLGRLLWTRKLLSEGFRRVLWFDADVVVFDPSSFRLPQEPTSFFTREIWLAEDREYVNVNNSVMCFCESDPLLDFYIQSCFRLFDGAGAQLNRLSLGTTFLTALTRAVPLRLVRNVGLLDNRIMKDVIAGGGQYLARYLRAAGREVCAANLCASLGTISPEHRYFIPASLHESIVEHLLHSKSLWPTL